MRCGSLETARLAPLQVVIAGRECLDRQAGAVVSTNRLLVEGDRAAPVDDRVLFAEEREHRRVDLLQPLAEVGHVDHEPGGLVERVFLGHELLLARPVGFLRTLLAKVLVEEWILPQGPGGFLIVGPAPALSEHLQAPSPFGGQRPRLGRTPTFDPEVRFQQVAKALLVIRAADRDPEGDGRQRLDHEWADPTGATDAPEANVVALATNTFQPVVIMVGASTAEERPGASVVMVLAASTAVAPTIARAPPCLAQPDDAFGRRPSEQPRVLPAELRSAQVADSVTCVARVHLLEQHQAPGFVQPERLLVLERAHRGDRFETLVERRRAHVGRSGHLLDGDGLREISRIQATALADPVHSGLRLSDLGDTSTNRTAQQTDQDLVDHQRSEEIGVAHRPIRSSRRVTASMMASVACPT